MLTQSGHHCRVCLIHAPLVLMFCTMAVLGMGASISFAVADASDQSREDRLRAGYLLNFVKFVEWPAFPANAPLAVCFIGGSGVHSAFDTSIRGKSVGNHPLVTREVRGRSDAAGCGLIYIQASAAPGASDSVSKSIPPATLTVSDAPDFLANGGIIEMFTRENHLRFNIGLSNARRANLRIGSDLLRLAVQVKDNQ